DLLRGHDRIFHHIMEQAGMLLAPFAAPNIMAMSLTGLSYPQYLLWGAGPYLIVMLITAVILSFWIDKKAKKDPNGEKI
ncbi:hypothetical protein NE462_27620, partial [Blautia hominis]|nr:hypothetical protein [Blautia hominis]